MKDPLGVSPSKGNQRTAQGKEKKFLLTSVGIKPTTSGLDLPFYNLIEKYMQKFRHF